LGARKSEIVEVEAEVEQTLTTPLDDVAASLSLLMIKLRRTQGQLT